MTNAKLLVAIRRYALAKGVPVATLTDAEIGLAVLRSLAKTVRDSAIDQQRQEALQAQQAALETQLLLDNDLYDEVPP